MPKIKKRTLLIGIGLILLLFFVWIFKDLPSPTKLQSGAMPSSTVITDRNGKILYEIYTEKNRVPVKLGDLPPYLKDATIAAEDKNFYKHHGFDFRGIIRAAFNTVFRRSLQGGSTITQQLVKNALLTQERTLQRKIREAILTIATETIYSKDQILEMYLNQAPYGGTAWGIETAAEVYFGKHAKDLTISEATLLVGLPASPTRYSPFGAHPELAKERQGRVINQMVEAGFITKEKGEEVLNEKLSYAINQSSIKAPHFSLYVKEMLVEKYGEKIVSQGGLRVTTTLDIDLQDFAQQTVASEVAKLKKAKVTNGSAMITNPKTGEILAMVGSADYFSQDIDGNVNITIRPRQPGSSIKPLNYALAIEKRLLTPASVLNDNPTCFDIPGQKLYCPMNYNGQFQGPVQLRFALGNSLNIPAVKVLAVNTLEEFVKKANEMGISTFTDPSRYGLSLTLGGGEVTMIDMTTAFSAFPNLGIKQESWAIAKIEDKNGKTIYEHKNEEGPRVLSMETAYLIDHILLDNNARSSVFGPSSWLVVKNHPEVSVKTGTTNDLRDNWTIGWTPSYLVTTWVGNNDNSPMGYIASGVTGASPIWNKIMTRILKDKKEEWPMRPDGIVGAQVCSLTGKSSNPGFPCSTRFEYFIEGTIPPQEENPRQQAEIDKTTNQLATDKTLPENKETQEKQIITDILGTKFCLDCSLQTEPVIVKPQNLSITPIAVPSASETNNL